MVPVTIIIFSMLTSLTFLPKCGRPCDRADQSVVLVGADSFYLFVQKTEPSRRSRQSQAEITNRRKEDEEKSPQR